MPRLLLCTLWFLLSVASQTLIADERPNFVWIMSEDNSKHYLKMFDESGTPTPNIEKMAVDGVTFERAFSNAPVCSVARTTLITMAYAPRMGAQFHRRIKMAKMPDGWKMFPALLREDGYYTTNQSKKDYNVVETQGTWNESSKKAHWRNRPEGSSFFHVQTLTNSHEGSLHFPQSWVDAPNNQTDPNSVSLAPYHPDTPLFRLTYARYHDRIQTIDNQVGKIIDQLQQDGLLENTFVFYFGDHGGVLPGSKGYVRESGLHVPLVIRIPEKWRSNSTFDRGDRTQGFVEFVDFGPTVLSLAGLDVPDHVDGTPFMGSNISSEEVLRRDETFGYADRMDEKYDLCRSLRRGNWKYIRNYRAIYPDGLQNNYRYINLAWQQWRELGDQAKLTEQQNAFFLPKPAEQLFDLSVDPHEVNNLAVKPEYQEKLLEMREALTKRVKSLPDLSFFPESELVAEALDGPIDFGETNAAKIAKYVDLANVALLQTDQALPLLKAAVQSNDPMERYWAYSTASILGSEAAPLFETAKMATQSDDHLLVKLRAAEFLGVTNRQDPIPTVREIVEQSSSPVVNLIALQSLVLFRDGPYEYDCSLDTSTIRALDDQVLRRIGYLDGLTNAQIRQRIKAIKR